MESRPTNKVYHALHEPLRGTFPNSMPLRLFCAQFLRAYSHAKTSTRSAGTAQSIHLLRLELRPKKNGPGNPGRRKST